MMRKQKFTFVGRDGSFYVWQSTRTIGPTDSRVEEIRCLISWFWGTRDAESGDDDS